MSMIKIKYLSLLAFLLLLSWIFVIVLSGAGWNILGITWDFSNTGAFGDSFGPLGAAMGAAAATGAFLAWHEQRKELNRVRENDVQNKKDAQTARDEQTFFNLVKFFQDNVSLTDIQRSESSDKKGQDAFAFILQMVDRRITQGIGVSYRITFDRYVNDLGHYFRIVYNIVNFVDGSSLENKYFYVKVLRSLLSNAEIALIGLNCEHGEGREKFKPLVEKYAILKNLSHDLIQKYELDKSFSSSAFSYQR